MALDYDRIRRENEKRYGTDIARIGKMLFADTYADRTHFIFELLQNAEDAIARRGYTRDGSRAVSFDLTRELLRVSHFGDPFIEDDVRGICGIGQSTKAETLTEIGHFGIGFKSVYAFTDRPEIHSGPEDFAIDSFVWPFAVQPIDDKNPDETVFLFPFKPGDESAYIDISSGLKALGAQTLPFLRQIEEIKWNVEDGRSGHYLREGCPIDDNVRRVTVIGQVDGEEHVDEEQWLIFSRQVTSVDGRPAGPVEIAFSDSQDRGVQRVGTSPLVAFFPTALETHLGFLMQGPYRTTPNRENIPHFDDWNKHLVRETASLLITSLLWLRDNKLLDVAVLGCLPINATQFGQESLFNPLFESAKAALRSKPLLPRYDNGYVSASRAQLGRTAELRELFSPEQLSTLYGQEQERHWLSSEISQERMANIRHYLVQELNVDEATPQSIIRKLNQEFLENQPDDWILRLYEFLSGQPALRPMLGSVPLIRLKDGTHVTPDANGKYRVFLPSDKPTKFPTVLRSVCRSETARKFLESLELREVDPIDDVIENVIPRYQDGTGNARDDEYKDDIQLILNAYDTKQTPRRDELVAALRTTKFVKAIDAGNGSKQLSIPFDVYLATDEYRTLFTGVKGVLFVDNSYACICDDSVLDLLEKCGATPSDRLDNMVINHILPKYQASPIEVSNDYYKADIERILVANEKTTNTYWQSVLLKSLCAAKFVPAVDAGTGEQSFALPRQIYLATRQLKELFNGVESVLLADEESYACLRGERARDLLEKCGAARYLKPVEHHPRYSFILTDRFNDEELEYMRTNAGSKKKTYGSESIQDQTLFGLDPLLDLLPHLDSELRFRKAKLLWKAIVEFEWRRGGEVFFGKYSWRNREYYNAPFPAVFVEILNDTKWVPSAYGELELPQFVDFETLGWEENPFLQSMILFKPPLLKSLAREAGLEPEAIELMKEHGVTTEKLREFLGVTDGTAQSGLESLDGEEDTPPPAGSTRPASKAGGAANGGRRAANDTPPKAIAPEIEPPISGPTPAEAHESEDPFAKKFFQVQTATPAPATESPVWITEGGPKTEESAEEHTRESSRVGRSGAHVRKSVTRWEPTEADKELADKFKSMAKGDYLERCQICGTTFKMRNGELQVFVVHIVQPSKDSRTNHFGDLLSLCGRHYAFVRYGRWAWLDPETKEPFARWESMRNFALAATETMDQVGYRYVPVSVRFSNIYPEWASEPTTIDEEIRYSKPHWTNLCELLKT